MSSPSLGQRLANRFQGAQRAARRSLLRGARDLPVVQGLTSKGTYNQPPENVLVAATNIMVASNQIFRYGSEIVRQTVDDDEYDLLSLNGPVEKAAAGLANIFSCRHGDEWFAPPTKLVGQLLARGPTRSSLPAIKTYARRPVFDENFQFLGPGWHPESQVLVHGVDVEPVLYELHANDAFENLPHLNRVLSGFPFRSPADKTNTVAALLTGILANLFVACGKPPIIIDSNQPNTGKTSLAQLMVTTLDGREATPQSYTPNEEELEKKIGALLRGRPCTAVLIDNAKTVGGQRIGGAFLETMTTGPEVSTRILKTSDLFVRRNDYLWLLTMNQTQATPDLFSRALPIRLYIEGDPKQHDFGSCDPVVYVGNHREELLGELYGMVLRWRQVGGPHSTKRHRLRRWAEVVGGVLEANGFHDFLDNLDDAAQAFDTDLDKLATLAELAFRDAREMVQLLVGEEASQPQVAGRRASDLVNLCRQAGVLEESPGTRSNLKSLSTTVGNFLKRHVNRTVTVECGPTPGTATLRQRPGSSNSKFYYFSVRLNDEPAAAGGAGAGHGQGGVHSDGSAEVATTAVEDNMQLVATSIPLGPPEMPEALTEPQDGALDGNTEDWNH